MNPESKRVPDVMDVDSLLAKEGYFIKFRSLLRHFFYDRTHKWQLKKPISERFTLSTPVWQPVLSLFPTITHDVCKDGIL